MRAKILNSIVKDDLQKYQDVIWKFSSGPWANAKIITVTMTLATRQCRLSGGADGG